MLTIACAASDVYKHIYRQTPFGGFMNTVRWNIAVSPDTDQSVRMFLASQGGGHKGDLSRFIEEAVRAYLFERAVNQAKKAAADMSEEELNALIDEAVQWAREH
jgi:predicted glycosyltransferase